MEAEDAFEESVFTTPDDSVVTREDAVLATATEEDVSTIDD